MAEEPQTAEADWKDDYVPKTEQEIFDVAMGIYDGNCRGTWEEWASKDPHMITTVFMTLALGGLPLRDWMVRNEIAHIYEFMHAAGPRSVNGLPMFLSHFLINKSDMAKVVEKYTSIKAAIDAVKAPKATEES